MVDCYRSWNYLLRFKLFLQVVDNPSILHGWSVVDEISIWYTSDKANYIIIAFFRELTCFITSFGYFKTYLKVHELTGIPFKQFKNSL